MCEEVQHVCFFLTLLTFVVGKEKTTANLETSMDANRKIDQIKCRVNQTECQEQDTSLPFLPGECSLSAPSRDLAAGWQH